jgi:hypothetical protein
MALPLGAALLRLSLSRGATRYDAGPLCEPKSGLSFAENALRRS